MKVLWTIVVLLVIGAVAVLSMGHRAGDGSTSRAAARVSVDAVAGNPARISPATVVMAAPRAAEPAPGADAAPQTAPAPAPPGSGPGVIAARAEDQGPASATPSPSHSVAELPAPTAVPAQPGAPAALLNVPATVPAVSEPAPAPSAGAVQSPAPDGDKVAAGKALADEVVASLAAPGASPPPVAEPAAPDAAGNGLEANARFPADKLVPVKIENKPDGVMVLDGRFSVRGSGTKEDPYRFPWDLLVSAQETYKPRMGQMKMPQRVTMLDGKYVRVSGFVAFPITSANPREMLSMLNQWDGCCIGVPPTAYDAIEVKLANPANAKQRMAAHGTVDGKLKVDPYLDGGWLLGLYLMEDAKLMIDD